MLVIAAAMLMAVCLSLTLRDLNFVGSDEENLYLPAAWAVPFVNYPSELAHSLTFDNPFLVHGKEMTIWDFSLMQRLLHDQRSLWPMLLTVIIAWGLSAILVFEVSGSYWGQAVGLGCFVAFVTSFWPLVYVLLVKHQPFGLLYFLASLFVLQRAKAAKEGVIWFFLSGLLMAVSLYASTVSVLYLPFYATALFWQCRRIKTKRWPLLGAAIGFFSVIYYFNYPHFIGNIQEFLHYIQVSQGVNHFSFHQNILRGWVKDPPHTFGGVAWALKLLWREMPILFPAYVVCIILSWRRPGMVFLSLSPLVLALLSHVAQYGGNYFPCLVGVMMFLAYFAGRASSTVKVLILALIGLHVIVNAAEFFGDLLPGRMASIYLSRELQKLQVSKVYVPAENLLDHFLIEKMDLKTLRSIKFQPISNIYQARDGYIIQPPVVGSSIYLAMINRFTDFDKDIYLNELLRKRTLERYALASFKTMATSPIWRQEEEMLSYRDLMLHQFSGEYEYKSRLWILDAKALYADRSQNMPSQEYVQMVVKGIRNVGTKTNLYRYRGVLMGFDKPVTISSVPIRVYKVGDPQDEIVMYIYREQAVGWATGAWVPWTKNDASEPLSGFSLVHDHSGQLRAFHFKEPLTLTPGVYDFMIYRTGVESDDNFYRVYIDENERTDYLKTVPYPAGL
jgi:hypothetical protein